jgi:hypothetical protein
MKIAVATTLLVLAVQQAPAQEMPRFDVIGHCRQIAIYRGRYSDTLFRGCMEMEQSVYDGLKPRWPALSAAVRQRCIQIANFSGPGSYSLLKGCAQMEAEARERSQRRDLE